MGPESLPDSKLQSLDSKPDILWYDQNKKNIRKIIFNEDKWMARLKTTFQMDFKLIDLNNWCQFTSYIFKFKFNLLSLFTRIFF